MVDPEWLGGKKDKRLYRKVRAEKQKGIRKKYDLMKAHLNERGDFHGEWNYTIVPRTPDMEI